MNKTQSRLRRLRQTRLKALILQKIRLSVHRTNLHIYATIIGSDARILASISTLDPEIRKTLSSETKGAGGTVAAALLVGQCIGERAVKAGIVEVAFDRSGFQYHGRVKALADAAREAGLKF